MPTQEELLRRITELEAENAKLRERLARAKNPEPVQRPNFERVKRLARNACMEVKRWKNGGFVLSFGSRSRWFRRLKDIWEIFTSDDWKLSEIFSKKVLPPIPRRSPSKVRDIDDMFPSWKSRWEWWHKDTLFNRREVMPM